MLNYVNCFSLHYNCSMTNLESLELRDNLLRSLPGSMVYLVNLKLLDVGGNLLENVVCHKSLQLICSTVLRTNFDTSVKSLPRWLR